jgi:Tfp pilus assembly protein PilO
MRTLKQQVGWYQRSQWVMGAMAGAGLLLFYFGAYRPNTSARSSVRAQIQSRQRQLESDRTRASSLPMLFFQVQQLEGRVKTYDRQFPRRPELGQLIRDMTQISQQLSLQEWKYQPGAPRRGDGYFELPIQMSFQGDFLNVASFLRQVEDMQRLTWVRRLEIKSKPGQSGAVDAVVTLNVYFSEG